MLQILLVVLWILVGLGVSLWLLMRFVRPWWLARNAATMRSAGARVPETIAAPAPQLDAAQMQHAVEMQRSSRLTALQEAIIDRFVQSGQLEAPEWERVRDRVVLVHDLLSREDAADLARMSADREAAEPVVASVLAQSLSPLDTFEHIATLLPETQRLRLLGEVDHPLYSQLYVPAV